MGNRIKLTGYGSTGPVWVWPAHITAIFASGTDIHPGRLPMTCINVVGAKDPIGVRESPETVIDMIDAAADGLLP